MQAQDIMTKDVVTVSPDAPTSQVAQLLLEHKISAVPVTGSSGIVIGMVSEGDLWSVSTTLIQPGVGV